MTSFSSSYDIGDPGKSGFAARILTWAGKGHAAACAMLLVLSLACFLPGFVSLQPMDRDEPRFAQATKQMLETGDLIDIRFQDEARHKKPVGIYWIQASVVAAAEFLGVSDARTTVSIYRIPSLFGALGTVFLTYWAALAFLGRRGAFLSAALMAASIILIVESKLAKTDAMLTLCSTAVLGGLARAYLGQGAAKLPVRTCLLFWGAMAAGILIKGPMVVMFAGLAALALSIKDRSAFWLTSLRLKPGLLAVAIIVLPWFVAIALKSHGEFFQASVGQDMLGKVGTAQKVHWAPPGFYLVAFFATFWPGAVLAAIAVPFAWKNRRIREIAFCLAWIIPSWIVFEAVPTKLPHYVMPLYPAIAILIVAGIGEGFVGPNRPLAKLASWLIPAIPLALGFGLAAAGWVLDRSIPYAGFVCLLLASAVAVWARNVFARGEVVRCVMISLAASVLVSIGVFGLTQPVLSSLKLSPRLAEAVKGMKCADPAVATLGYREPSLVFLVGTKLDMMDSALQTVEFLKAGGCRMAFVENRYEAEFHTEAERLGIKPVLVSHLAGFNINGGRRLDISVYVPPRTE